jgi:hypothetical protein
LIHTNEQYQVALQRLFEIDPESKEAKELDREIVLFEQRIFKRQSDKPNFDLVKKE